MADFKYEVTGECGVISDNGKGTVMKLRLVSWNDRPAKYDIRSWYEKDGEEKMNKGVTLTKEELLTLGNLIDEIRKANKTDEKSKTKAKASTTAKATTKAKSAACSARTTKTSTNTKKPTAKVKATKRK